MIYLERLANYLHLIDTAEGYGGWNWVKFDTARPKTRLDQYFEDRNYDKIFEDKDISIEPDGKYGMVIAIPDEPYPTIYYWIVIVYAEDNEYNEVARVHKDGKIYFHLEKHSLFKRIMVRLPIINYFYNILTMYDLEPSKEMYE